MPPSACTEAQPKESKETFCAESFEAKPIVVRLFAAMFQQEAVLNLRVQQMTKHHALKDGLKLLSTSPSTSFRVGQSHKAHLTHPHTMLNTLSNHLKSL